MNQNTEVAELILDDLETIKDHDPNTHTFHLPKSIFKSLDNNDLENPPIVLDNFLSNPNFDELDEVARDHEQQLKPLTQEQLLQIRRTGGFFVPSERFPGQNHHWELNNLFQQGTQNSIETFREGIAWSTELFVVYIPNRLWRGEYVTLWSGIKNTVMSILGLPVLLFGYRNMLQKAPSISRVCNIRKEKLCDLILDPTVVDTDRLNGGRLSEFVSIDGIHIHVYNLKEIRNRLKEPYEKFKENWDRERINRRRRIASELVGQCYDEDLPQRVVDTENQQEQEHIFEMIHQQFPKGEAERICGLMNAFGAVREIIKHYNDARDRSTNCYMDELCENHPVLSRIAEWKSRKKTDFIQNWTLKYPLEDAIRKGLLNLDGTSAESNNNLKMPILSDSERYLLEKNIEAQKAIQQQIAEETTTRPTTTYDWDFRIYRPSNWIITQRKDGPYRVNKYKTVETTSEHFGWRLTNFCVRTGYYINNGLFWVISNGLYGPYGLRSLIGLEDFQPDRTIDSDTGELIPTGSKYTTWFGKIRKLWRNIQTSRREFEEAPDEGFFGKSFTRPFNIVWNYVFKGFFGTTLSLVYHPVFVLLQTLLTIVVTTTSPVWGFGGALFKWLFDILIYDLDAPSNSSPMWFPLFQLLFKDFLIKGIGQLVLAPLAIVGNTFLGLGGYVWSGIRLGCRSTVDFLMYHLFIKHKGRVPNRDGFVARRTSGPGLSMRYYQQISKEFGVLMIQFELEREQMSIYKKQQLKFVGEPEKRLNNYLDQFKDAGLVKDQNGKMLKSFGETKRILTKKLQDDIQKHNDSLYIKGNVKTTTARFTKEDLVVVIDESTELCRTFYTDVLIPQANSSPIEESIDDSVPNTSSAPGGPDLNDSAALHSFWASKNLIPKDFRGLAIWYLEKVFGKEIMVPLEETDATGFKTKVDHINFEKYFKMIIKGEPRDDLDVVVQNHPVIADTKYPTESDVIVVTPDNMISPDNATPQSVQSAQSMYEKFLYIAKK